MELHNIFEKARQAARKMVLVDDGKINNIIGDTADLVAKNVAYILKENRKDLDRMSPEDPKYDRLQLTEERILSLAEDQRSITRLPSPVHSIISSVVQPNGLLIEKVSVPFGVIGVIYEARPNVTLDVFSLCLKSGNVCVLKGGSDAEYSNRAIISLIHSVLQDYGLDTSVATLLPPGREATAALLQAEGYVDLIIPRGSSSLIDYVRENASIPVIETGAGICHAYFDVHGDLQKGAAIIENAKTRRVSVCNALDCLLIHEERLADLPALCEGLEKKNVKIYADPEAYRILENCYDTKLLKKATPESFGTEFLSYTMAIKTVSGIEEALEHIAAYSSKHSECIISESEENQKYFLNLVDAACVYSNVPTSFTDGAQFGLGAEIGISTQKLHARGPMGLEELTTYKWIIRGNGQIRS